MRSRKGVGSSRLIGGKGATGCATVKGRELQELYTLTKACTGYQGKVVDVFSGEKCACGLVHAFGKQ